MRNPLQVISGLLVLLALTGCGMLARPQADFETAIANFTQRLRWLDLIDAAQYFQSEHRNAFLDQFEALDGLHVTDVRYQIRDQGQNPLAVETQLEIDYYQLPSVSIKTRRLQLAWHYVGGDRWHQGMWQIVGPFPDFP